MISESALSLLLPPPSVTSASGTPSQSIVKSLLAGLPSFAQRGGILTPMTAFGDVLLRRLTETGRFELEHGIVGAGSQSVEEGWKNV